ncbi:MAG: RNHCP domain-containing protein [Actinomycetota bacterium]|nr:RNHCP domain-containing protein [Actinomycetota bacterium]
MPRAKADAPAPTSFVCKKCGRKVRMPSGWTIGPAVRRHYWAKHPDVMRGDKKS